MKWFAVNHVAGAFLDECEFETRYFVPSETRSALLKGHGIMNAGRFLKGNTTPSSTTETITLSQWAAPFIKSCDVHFGRIGRIGQISGLIVECGDTDLLSLVLPLAARLVGEVVLIPHPHRSNKGSEWTDFSTPIPGFRIDRPPLSQRQQDQLVKRLLGRLDKD